MAWPATAVVTDDPVTAAQLNGLPVMIANTTLAAPAASIDFTSIPSHYAHLVVECYLRGTNGGTFVEAKIRFNNDTTGNYDAQYLLGSAAAISAGEQFAATTGFLGAMPDSGGGANLFSGHKITVHNYANASNNKVYIATAGIKYGTASGNLDLYRTGGFWRSNAACNRLTIFADAGNLAAGSRATLFGWP